MVHVMVRQEAGPQEQQNLVRGSQRCSRESWKTTLEIQGTWLENWHSDGQKKAEVEDDDDVVRTRKRDSNTVYCGTAPLHLVYITLSTYKTGKMGGGRIQMVNMTH